MNNKVAAISKMMELPGDNNVVRVLESKFLLCINKSWAIVIFVLTSFISLSNFITLDSKNLPKCLSLIVTFYILYSRFKINVVFMS